MTTSDRRRWYQRLLGATPKRARGSYRPWLEALEDRTLPSFLGPANFPAGVYPHAVAVEDVNADGKPDLIVANQRSETVSVLLGNGNGTFEPVMSFPVGTAPRSVAVADVNGDGLPDLVTVNASDNTVSVLLGQHR